MVKLTVISGMLLILLCPGLPATQSQAPMVKFCDLVHSTDLYAGKIIRTKAILVENHTPRVDGGDPYLYDPSCRGKEDLVFADWSQFAPDGSRALSELDGIRGRADKRGNSRALVTVVGKFESAGRYGHLDWAAAQLVITSVERVEPVSTSARWPKEYD